VTSSSLSEIHMCCSVFTFGTLSPDAKLQFFNCWIRSSVFSLFKSGIKCLSFNFVDSWRRYLEEASGFCPSSELFRLICESLLHFFFDDFISTKSLSLGRFFVFVEL
jgi:hypothetical protein